MAMTALGFWIFTAFAGAYLWLRVSRFGRSAVEAGHTRLPDHLLLGHPSAAFLGLVAWIGYLLYDEKWLAWVAFGSLVVAASAGALMRLQSMKRDHPITVVRDDPGEAPQAARVSYAEHELPRSVMTGHGVLASVTIVLVFLEALLD